MNNTTQHNMTTTEAAQRQGNIDLRLQSHHINLESNHMANSKKNASVTSSPITSSPAAPDDKAIIMKAIAFVWGMLPPNADYRHGELEDIVHGVLDIAGSTAPNVESIAAIRKCPAYRVVGAMLRGVLGTGRSHAKQNKRDFKPIAPFIVKMILTTYPIAVHFPHEDKLRKLDAATIASMSVDDVKATHELLSQRMAGLADDA